MKKLIYVHDLRFYKKGDDYYTSSNLPEKYFDRFFDAGIDEVVILSRLVECDDIPKGYYKMLNKKLKVSSGVLILILSCLIRLLLSIISGCYVIMTI